MGGVALGADAVVVGVGKQLIIECQGGGDERFERVTPSGGSVAPLAAAFHRALLVVRRHGDGCTTSHQTTLTAEIEDEQEDRW
jgi:hypothetical protein